MLLYSLAKSDVVEVNHHMILQGYNAVLTVVQDHPYVPTIDSKSPFKVNVYLK